MTWICQDKLPQDMRNLRALPGVQPLEMANWLHVDEAYAAQMAERIRLLEAMPNKIIATTRGSELASEETLATLVAQLSDMAGFEQNGTDMRCPDGRVVSLVGDPLFVMAQLVQEDMCIMQKPEGSDEHILSAAVLCFPANWTLSEKIGRSMSRIHAPVDDYTDDIQRRVQRLFDGVKAGRPLWRFNRATAGPQLYQPRSETDYEELEALKSTEFLRAERQSLIRLPESGAVLFSIHTYVIAPQDIEKPDPIGQASFKKVTIERVG